MRNSLQFQHVAVSRTDNGVSTMALISVAPLTTFDPEVAAAHGFRNVDGIYVRDVTDEQIDNELARTAWSGGQNGEPFVSLKDICTGWRRIEEKDIPSDRTFRNAWFDDGKAITVDLDRARHIVRQAIRAARPPQFAALDNAMRPLEAKQILGKLTAAEKVAYSGLEAQRQELRDAPSASAIDDAKSEDDLRQLLPL